MKENSENKENENMHEGHRKRLKQKYLDNGIESLSEIETLELLLFYSIPRRNTNDIAHKILEKFSNLEGVFNADAKLLAMVEDVGEHTAALIKLIKDIHFRIETNKTKPGVYFTNSYEAGKHLVEFFSNKQHEVLYAFFLNKGNRLLGWEKVVEGTADKIMVDTAQIVRAALRYKTCSVVLAHNHPGGKATPSNADKITTGVIRAALSVVGINLKDHYVIANGDYMSFNDSNILYEEISEEDEIE